VDCGFEHPTHIQSKLIPDAVKGHDILGQSKTGTGKTAAFALPMLQNIKKDEPFAGLALVPTRELAIQVTREYQ
jgi:ATP-dependent RNA helicase DeaD